MKKAISYLLILTLTFTMLFSGVSFSFAAETQERDPAAGEVYVEDEVLVVFEDEVSEKKAKTIVEDADVKTEEVEEIALPETKSAPEETPYVVTLDEKKTTVQEAVEELDKDPDVAYAQPNYLYTTDENSSESAPVNDPKFADQWDLDYIHAKEAWDYIDELEADSKAGTAGPISVATLDSGIDLGHEDLNDNIDKENCVSVHNGNETVDADGNVTYNYPKYTADTTLPNGHGTSVASAIAATSNNDRGVAGVAAGNNNDLVRLMGINVFDGYSRQGSATTADIVKGLHYACAKGAKVINMALGHTWNETVNTGKGDTHTHDDTFLQEEIDKAVADYKITFVATAGNHGNQQDWYPSDLDNVISVINTVEYDDAWSSDCKFSNSDYGPKKDLSAPGNKIWCTEYNGTYHESGGTSMAAPHVAAVAAMVLYVNPKLTPEQVEDILCGTTIDLYTDGRDDYTGYGNVDALAAVQAAAEVAGGAVPDPDRDRSEEIELAVEDGGLAAPANLKAANTGMEDITVSWDRVAEADDYSVLRSETGKEGSYKEIATVPNTSSSTISYVDNAATYSKTYYYKVNALSTSEETHKKLRSKEGDSVSAKSAISNRLKTPTVTAKGTSYNSVKISWNKISGADHYRVWRATSEDGKYTKIAEVGQNTKSYTDKKCTFGKQYWYKVYARGTASNGKDIRSTGSKPVAAKSVLPAPSFSITSVDYRTNKVSWKKVAGASGYRIFRSTSKNGTYSKVKTTTKSSTTSWENTNLKAGKAYYYKIRPYRTVSGKRVYGTLSGSKKHTAKPKKPTFTLKKKGRRVTLTLKKNSKLNGYVIYRQKGKGKWKKVRTATVNGRRGATYSCTLARGNTYSFKVRSYKKVSGKRIYSLYSSVKKKKI